MVGTEALHLNSIVRRSSALTVRSGRTASLTVLLSRIAVLIAGLMALALLHPHRTARAADISLPAVSAHYTIFVKGDVLTRETRGSYNVLAFHGHCEIKQGEFAASSEELILWIDQTPLGEDQKVRKFICSLQGGVELRWNGNPQLRDERWMGRLFSYEEVSVAAQSEDNRRTIPQLDWGRDRDAMVIPAQYSSPPPSSGAVINGLPGSGAPPLLPSGGAPLSSSSVPAPPGLMISPSPTTLPNNPPALAPSGLQPSQGAVQWPAAGGTSNSPLLPSSGLVIPEDGSPPYPATGLSIGQAQPESITALAPSSLPNTGPVGAKQVTFRGRSSKTFSTKVINRADDGTSALTISGGVIIDIRDLRISNSGGGAVDYGSVSIEFDNAVLWKAGGLGAANLTGATSTATEPVELYMEGNIVLRQGERVIYADRMYYNVETEYGMVLGAEILTPVPQYQGLLRLKADVLEQRNRQNFLAYGAALTSSRLGVPRYWFQADRISMQDMRPESTLAPTAVGGLTGGSGARGASGPMNGSFGGSYGGFNADGTALAADTTGATADITNMRATSRNNFVYVMGLPVAYWPVFSTNLARPSFYLTGIKFKSDQIFGSQVYADWDLYQLLSLPQIDGTAWTLSTDYLSKRGPALGTRFTVDRPDVPILGPTQGYFDAWGLVDSGRDVIGSDRHLLTPEATNRGRAIGRFRSHPTQNMELWSELGYITDRNFMEQYFENEWDQQKDYTTGLRLRNYNGNRMFDIAGQARINKFFTETEQLPRLDHYWMGQDLGEYLTWSEHTNVGYLHQRVASTPTDPKDAAKFALLPWETDSEGIRAVTRQELNAPLNLGAFNVVPFLSGEAGYWGEDTAGNPVTRLVGQGGVRTNLPFWRAYPNVESDLLDIRGIAHKVAIKSELFYADASQDLSRFPLYDALDDNSQEHFRRRLIFNTFGGALPPQFDERSYALRQGMQRWVAAGSSEIADDMTQARIGLHQRWQTKRGVPGRERITDLVAFDVDAIFFPNATRDNFGEDVGAINYSFRYHLGDRVTLLSDGYFDVFSQGLKTLSAGAMFSRPGRVDAYIGMLSMEGPISSNVLNGYMNYRLDDKWIFSGGAAFDFGQVGSVGQPLAHTRRRIGSRARRSQCRQRSRQRHLYVRDRASLLAIARPQLRRRSVDSACRNLRARVAQASKFSSAARRTVSTNNSQPSGALH
ncbi:MAG: organic solvent tolerance protein OstA [Pirellulales bacterium]